MDHDMRSNSDVECGETNPELGESFTSSGDAHSVDQILVWILAGLGVHDHLLHSYLHVVEW